MIFRHLSAFLKSCQILKHCIPKKTRNAHSAEKNMHLSLKVCLQLRCKGSPRAGWSSEKIKSADQGSGLFEYINKHRHGCNAPWLQAEASLQLPRHNNIHQQASCWKPVELHWWRMCSGTWHEVWKDSDLKLHSSLI